MTIAIGVCCSEGTVLGADSMTYLRGDAVPYLSDEKVFDAGDVVYVHAGTSSPGWRPPRSPAESFEDTARGIYAAFAAEFPGGAGTSTGHDVIVASRQPTPGESYRMGMITREGERWSRPEGQVFVTGCAHEWAERRALADVSPPESLQACVAFAVGLATSFIEGERSPLVALPLNLLVTAHGRAERYTYGAAGVLVAA